MKKRILIVEDNVVLSQLQKEWLEKAGYEVVTTMSEPAARKLICREVFTLILSDVRLPEGDGIALLEWLNKGNMRIPFVVTTDYASFPDAVRAIKLGAKDYLPKPVHRERLLELTNSLLEPLSAVRAEKVLLHRGSSKAREVERLARLAAPSDIAVMITGANGTGKESVAQGIHHNSDRRNQPFVAINCGGIPGELAASLFFGYVKGAFTGADCDRNGYFEQADGGTLFLDEVGTLPLGLQAMLLRVLEEHVYVPLGSTRERTADVRIISATNEDLCRAIAEGRFREDLYHRLCEFALRQPSLAECPEDILPFAEFFRERYSKEYRKETAGFTDDCKELLLRYPWPGNIRELKNRIKRAVIVSQEDKLLVEDMGFDKVTASDSIRTNPSLIMKLKDEEREQEQIRLALEKTGNNVTQTSRLLGISRQALYAKLKKYRLR